MTDKTNYMDFNKYHRNAVHGEIVNYYENGDRRDQPKIGFVTFESSYTINLSVLADKASRCQVKQAVRHIDDPHWEDKPHILDKHGAWDFHPVYGSYFTKVLQALHMHEVRKQLNEEREDGLSPEEFEACESLKRLGPKISNIAKDCDTSTNKLRQMDEFMKQFNEAKKQEWEEKNNPKKSEDSKETPKATSA